MTHNQTPSLKTWLTTTAALCGLTVPAVALAQTTPAPAAKADDPIEVVITAQKRTERLKDVTVAASVVDTTSLAKANATDISDLNKLVPSVELKGSFNGRVPMAMRGVSTSANEGAVGLTSGVAILIDGVPTSSDSMAANQLSDVARVEVLKGPQSTLGGRSASAGVINIVTRKPTKVFTADLSAMLTSDNQSHGEAFISGPLVDKLSASLSLFDDKTTYAMENLATAKKTTTEGAGGRAKLLFSPTDDLDILLSARHSYMNSDGNNFVYNYVTPGASIFGIPAPFLAQDVLLAGYNPRAYDNVYYNSVSGASSRITDNDLSLNVDWRLGDYTLTSTTADQKEKQALVQDVPIVSTYFFDVLTGGHAPHYGNVQTINEDIETKSQEFKIASPIGQPVNFVAGLFWSDTNVVAHTNRDWVANPQITTATSDTKTLGLYGRVNWSLSDNWKLITGLRYNNDKVAYIIDQTANNAEGAYLSSGSHTAGTTVGDLTLQRKFGDDAMVYATYAKGYKPAAYNTAAQLKSTDALAPVNPEDIAHFELGSKGSYFSRNLLLNVSLFHTQYKNYQIQVFDTGTAWPAPLKLDNAGEAQTDGLELDTTWRAQPGLTFTVNAAFIDAKFVTYTGAPCYNSQTLSLTPGAGLCYQDLTGFQSQDLSGQAMPDAPKTKINVSFDKRFSLSHADLEFAGSYAWRSSTNMQADHNPQTVQPSFGILNLSMTASPKDAGYSMTFFVNNVTDQFYATNLEDFFAGIWGTGANAVISQPARDSHRYMGVRLNAQF